MVRAQEEEQNKPAHPAGFFVQHLEREACAALDAVSPRGGAKSRSVMNGFFVG
ncbi:hypothetical protein NMS_1006 [Nonlabens marinus S1-08]|uniref:Uncharacterized protein n=1 Tax=Nonlabens marinus S1-08 TaxID=1454201 RepID=W8VQD3_9FLAO|nr:hypothetical protein NMS_1006 [Nonlabens marinus S1-08]